MSIIYRDAVMGLNPYRYWRMNDDGANGWIDSETAFGDQSLDVSTPVYQQPSIQPDNSDFSIALNQTGSGSDYFATTDYVYSGDYTISIVFKIINASSSTRIALFDDNLRTMYVYQNTLYREGTAYPQTIIQYNVTNHLVIVFDGATQGKIYLNGVFTENFNSTASSAIRNIGKGYRSGNIYMRGYVTDIADFKRQLTAAEVSLLYAKWEYGVGLTTINGSIAETSYPHLWNTHLYNLSTGELVDSLQVDTDIDNTFTFSNVPDMPYFATVLAEQGDLWLPNLIVTTGTLVYPTKPSQTRFFFECTTAGTTGATEPTWDVGLNATTNDGTVVWMVRSALVQPVTHAPILNEI